MFRGLLGRWRAIASTGPYQADRNWRIRRGPIQWLVVCGSLLILAVGIGTAAMVGNFRERTLQSTSRELENTVLLLARHFDQQLEEFGVIQNDIAAQIQMAGIASSEELAQWMSGYDMHQLLKVKMRAISNVGAISVFNKDGTLINSSNFYPTPEVNIFDRPYFQTLKSDPESSTVLSEPVLSRITGVWSMSLARKIVGPNGEFLGVMSRGVDPSHFGRFFASLSLGDSASISMFHRDGTLIARHPHRDEFIGQNFRSMVPGQSALADGERRTARVLSPIDNEERLAAVRGLDNFPVFVVASQTMSSALTNWRDQTRFLVIVAAITAVMIATILFLIVRQLMRQHRAAQQRITLQKQRLDTAINHMSQGLLLFDAEGRLVVVNQRYLDMYRLAPDSLKPGQSLRDVVLQRQKTGTFKGDIEKFLDRVMRDKDLHTTQVMETVDGRSIEIEHVPVGDGGWVTTHEDITARVLSDERIAHLAHYDVLTDLPNRSLFHEWLEQKLRHDAEQTLAVLYVDIDEFKSINDSLGHPVGDELLKEVAVRLKSCVGAGDFVARLGGDEFAVVLTSIKDRQDVLVAVTELYRSVREPFDCLGHRVIADASIGIAVAPEDGCQIDQLLKNADLAMYDAKAAGRRTHRFFEPGMDARARARRTLESDLRQAIDGKELQLHYQPFIGTQDGEIKGCEALLRWTHPERGVVSPAEFIPIAEETGLITQLGEWVLMTACAEAVTWPDHVKIAVNVSPIQFRSQTFGLKVAAVLAACGLPASRLEIEITEAVLIRDDEEALAILRQLREMGVRVALDDFGTGYSSLSYLQRFPFDKIKIDRCFINDVVDPAGSRSIVQAVTSIATARAMTTTAEGVETEQQLAVLRELGCTEMQGYLFSAAKPAGEIRKLLGAGADRIALIA
jgi:diguanylate cyclase (GGDEF)-like protein